jgi:hypothetical protein
MSKVQQAKDAQGYSTTPHSCANCKHFTCDKKTVKAKYGYMSDYIMDTNLRCSIGNFKVMKTATCNKFEKK